MVWQKTEKHWTVYTKNRQTAAIGMTKNRQTDDVKSKYRIVSANAIAKKRNDDDERLKISKERQEK